MVCKAYGADDASFHCATSIQGRVTGPTVTIEARCDRNRIETGADRAQRHGSTRYRGRDQAHDACAAVLPDMTRAALADRRDPAGDVLDDDAVMQLRTIVAPCLPCHRGP